VAERRSVAADVVGSNPTSRPKFPSTAPILTSRSTPGSQPTSQHSYTPAGLRPAWLTGFRPRRWLANGHLQTIAGNLLPRTSHLPPPQQEIVEVAPATAEIAASNLICLCHWQPDAASVPTVILVHGLEGSANSQYVIGNANKLWAAGCNVVRMNMRNCGGNTYWSGGQAGNQANDSLDPAALDPDSICPTLYHSGLSGDVRAVARHVVRIRGISRIAILGYSMGGNMVLKLAGELGDDPMPESYVPEIRACVAVSPAADLAASADALHRPINRIYEHRFLRALERHYLHKVSLYPQRYSAARAYNLNSIREFDEHITAHYSGFRGAEDYYTRSSASQFIERIPIPTLVLHALDDPFIRLLPETCDRLRANPNVNLIETRHGGHCAFLADANPAAGDDGYWAEHTALRFLQALPEFQP
jgi:predicted alpha/beta-fold hydrolase